MTDIIFSSTLSEQVHLKHAFFTRKWGNGGFSGQTNPEEVRKSRENIANYIGVTSSNFLSCTQIHSPDVVTVTQIWEEKDCPRADALVTDKRGIALGILTADCVPVLFADSTGTVIGAAHAGWRGALTGILENTLLAMEKLGARRKSVRAAIGPCIWQASYEVGPEFPAPFLAQNPSRQKFFRPAFRSDRYQFDLPGYVSENLRELGVGAIDASPADTYADPDQFFSHRYSTLHEEKRMGNLVSAIALV